MSSRGHDRQNNFNGRVQAKTLILKLQAMYAFHFLYKHRPILANMFQGTEFRKVSNS